METPTTSYGRNKLATVSLIAGVIPFLLWTVTRWLFILVLSPDFLNALGEAGFNLVFVYLPGIAALAALAAGIIALLQIRKSGEEGKFSAIAGILLGALTLPLFLYFIVQTL